MLRRHWLILLTTAGLGALGGVIYNYFNEIPTQYSAAAVFNLDSGGMGGNNISDLASALGMGGLSGPTDGNMFAGNNFFLLFSSKKLSNQVLLSRVSWDSTHNDLLVNYYIQRSGMIREAEKEDPEGAEKLARLRFSKSNPASFTLKEMTSLVPIRERMQANMAINLLDKKASFIELKTSTDSDTLSKLIVDTWLARMATFYRDSKSQKTRELLAFNERRQDSLYARMAGADRRVAASMNYNQYNIYDQSGKIAEQRQAQKGTMIQGLYMQSVQAVDALRNSLIRDTPLFTIIDEPVYPLDTIKYDAHQPIKGGIVIGLLVGVLIIVLINVLRGSSQVA